MRIQYHFDDHEVATTELRGKRCIAYRNDLNAPAVRWRAIIAARREPFGVGRNAQEAFERLRAQMGGGS